MHALIIEPQVFASFMIEDALRDAGYTSIALARTEEEAVASAEADPPDLVTAAVELEPGNGLRAVRAIRARHDPAVLFITRRAADVHRENPDPVLIRKPFVAADLPPAIARAERRRGHELACWLPSPGGRR
jgi:DNA-binding response OmpR family regulator